MFTNSFLRQFDRSSKRMNYLKSTYTRKVSTHSFYGYSNTLFSFVSELFDLTTHMQEDSLPELNAALGDTVTATQALVTKFVQLTSERKSSILQGDAFSEYQRAQNEVCYLRRISIMLS